ncbi:hypothetical protein MJM05_12475, partial [Salmonella enterica subsp. enterica serovar Montevideo]|nr:hypothetical protein [Salmonella enterica subsp. enterica serovar Montevideo]
NFGALFAFFVVNLCVFILFNFRMKAQRRIFAHVISPIMGMIVADPGCRRVCAFSHRKRVLRRLPVAGIRS